MKKLLTILIALAILAVVGCKKETEEPQPEPTPTGDIIVADITKVVDEQTRQAIQSIDTSDFTFIFNGSSTVIDELAVGDILVDSTSDKAPYGYLRKVTSISVQKNGETTVTTEMASLTEAVKKGSIDFKTGSLTMAHLERYELAKGVTLKNHKNTDFSVFSLDYDHTFENENGSITISGYTDLDIDFFFDFDWDWEVLPYPRVFVKMFESGVQVEQSASVMCVSEAGAGINKDISLGKFYFTPWTFMVGPVPVVFVPQIELFLEMNGTITAVYTATVSESFNGRLGVKYTDENDWSRIASKTFDTDYAAPNLTAGANFEAHVGPEVALLLYGIAGPMANISGAAKVEASLVTGTQNWNLDLIVGSRAQVGIKIDLIGFSDSWTPGSFWLFEETVLHLDNEPFGNEIYIATPVDDQSYLIGDLINITASYTGETPDEVEFIIDYNTVYTDTEAPFEYVWDTEGVSDPRPVISVSSKINGVEIASDFIHINLVTPMWDHIDLSSLGLKDNTNANDLFFNSTTNGWMTVDGPGLGMLLHSSDAGVSWQEIYSSSIPLKKMTMFNDNEGIFLDGDGEVMYTDDGGHYLSELVYGPYDRPSFQWNEVFDFATNSNGEIIGVGKDEGIPYFFRIHRVNMADHTPLGHFDVPYPNEYGAAPNIVMNGNNGVLYNVFDEDNTDKSYFMTTTDGGVSWEGEDFNVVTSNATLNDAYMPDETNIWIVGGDADGAIVLISNNMGGNWTKVGLTGVPEFSSVYFTSQDIGYATVKDWSDDFEAKLYKTQDGGHTWKPLIDTRGKYGMSNVFFLGQDFGILCGKGNLVYRYSID